MPFKKLWLALLFLPALAQAQAQAQQARAFSIFLDCSDFFCEQDFYRTELAFVNHVRDRTAADVHVLVTQQGTGGGGRQYSLAFYGQLRFAGISDTLTASTPQGATEDEQRQVIARTVRLGLVRYLARTPEGTRVAITLDSAKTGAAVTAAPRDPWNAWVFRVGANLNGNSESQYQSANINGSINASRTTEMWKTNLRVNEYYQDSKFDVDNETITTIRRDFGGSALQVRSLNDHWSLGGRAEASSSTYLNQKFGFFVAPTLEFDVYPYKESTRRQLIAQYTVGARHYVYNDTTVYFKTKETRPFETLSFFYSQKQKWGSIDLGASGYHLLDDLSKSRLNLSASTDVRIIKGLNLSTFIDYAVIHDQIYLAKGNLSKDEVLLRQSQLQTGYRAYFYISLSYTFGSVLNNVVNPRMNSGGDF